jgi:hypothetical protein
MLTWKYTVPRLNECEVVKEVRIPNTVVTSLPDHSLCQIWLVFLYDPHPHPHPHPHAHAHAHTHTHTHTTVPEHYVKPITHCSFCGTTRYKYQKSVKLKNLLYVVSRGAVLHIKVAGKSRPQLHFGKK